MQETQLNAIEMRGPSQTLGIGTQNCLPLLVGGQMCGLSLESGDGLAMPVFEIHHRVTHTDAQETQTRMFCVAKQSQTKGPQISLCSRMDE